MKLNECFIGKSSCPAEIITITIKDGSLFRVKVNYDNGLQHTLANKAVHPLVISTRKSECPIELQTVTSMSACICEILTVKLSDSQNVKAILVTDLSINTFNMTIPDEWSQYKSNWCDTVTSESNIDAEILLGSTTACLHPRHTH